VDQTPEMLLAPEEAAILPWEDQVCFPLPLEKSKGSARVAETLRQKVEDCKKAGCSEQFTVELKSLLTEYQSVFRLELGNDPPWICRHW
jgi:hypothetical protein